MSKRNKNKNKNRTFDDFNRGHGIITTLPEDITETVNEMIKSGKYYREVAEYIQERAGISISQPTICRYAKKLKATLQEFELAQRNFKILLQEIKKYPDLDATEGIVRLLSFKVLEAIQDTNTKEWKGLDPLKLIEKSTSLVRAASSKQNVDVKLKNIRDIALESFKDEIFDTLAESNPSLYKALLDFINQRKEID